MPCSSATAVERVTKLSFIHYPSDKLGGSERIAQSGVLTAPGSFVAHFPAMWLASTHASLGGGKLPGFAKRRSIRTFARTWWPDRRQATRGLTIIAHAIILRDDGLKRLHIRPNFFRQDLQPCPPIGLMAATLAQLGGFNKPSARTDRLFEGTKQQTS
jgi:hypothetical protein